MRIIAGEFRSRKIESPPDAETTRPIPDRVKESVFNLLRGHVEGARVLDVFAGTGSIGLEAISRGADLAVFVERDRKMAALLQRNIDALGAADRAEILLADALGPAAAARCPRGAAIIFMDPPYPLVRDPAGWARVRDQAARFVERLADDGFLALRTPWPFLLNAKDDDDKAPADLAITGAQGPETHDYGTTAVHLYMRERIEEPAQAGDER